MNKLKIAQITPYFYPALGGIEKATYETARRLVKKGHRVTVYTSKSNFNKFNTLPSEERIEGIIIKRFPEYFNLMSTWFPKIAQDEDILHFRNYCINPHTYLVKKYYGKKPIIVTFHGGFSREEGDFEFRWDAYGLAKYVWQYLFGKRYLKKIDRLLALHVWEKNNLISKGADNKKIIIVPNGVGDEAFKKYKPIKLDKPYFFYIGRIAKVKSLDHVIKVLPTIKDVYFVIAGADIGEGEKNRLIELALRLRVETRVKFVGEKRGEEKYQYIAGAEAIIIPSQWEMLSHTILESMAQAKTVIASDSYGNPYIVDHLKNGVIYPYGDLQSLKKYLIGIIEKKESYLILGKNARKKLWRDYRWDNVVDKIEKIYQSLVIK